jgi:hypothetical protein
MEEAMTIKVKRRTFAVRQAAPREYHVTGADGATLAVVYAKPGFASAACCSAARTLVERGLA